MNQPRDLGGLGRYREAIKNCSEAIRLDPGLSEACGMRGSIYAVLGGFERAVADPPSVLLSDSYTASVPITTGGGPYAPAGPGCPVAQWEPLPATENMLEWESSK